MSMIMKNVIHHLHKQHKHVGLSSSKYIILFKGNYMTFFKGEVIKPECELCHGEA